MNETVDQPNEVASEVVDRAEVRDGKSVVRYGHTEAALAELRQRFKDAAFDLTTVAGNRAARAARQELVALRTSLERKRVEFKAPAMAFGKAIDSEAKRLAAEIAALEDPIDEQIRADEARREAEKQARAEAEARRVAAIQERIAEIRGAVAAASGSKPGLIAEHIGDVERMVVGPAFEEFAPIAQAAKDETLAALRRMHATAQQQEAEAARIAAERAELERLRAEAAERDRLERVRIEAEQAAERERLAEERRRLDAERAAADAERRRLDAEAAAERAEADRVAREAREAEDRHSASLRAELQRQQAQEAARIAAERAEAERAQAEAAAARRRELEAAEAADRRVRRAAPQMLTALQGCIEHMEWSTDKGKAAHSDALAAIELATTELPSFDDDDIPY